MKEIKAYVHRNRIAHVVASLKESAAWSATGSGDHNLTVYMVKGSILPIDDTEIQFSMDVGDQMINEFKLELYCGDDHAAELAQIIRGAAHTGGGQSGWVYISEIQQALPIL